MMQGTKGHRDEGTKEKDSPAFRLMSLIYTHQGHHMPQSNERWDQSMNQALSLAIESGLRFDLTDFAEIAEICYRFGSEGDYALACRSYRCSTGRKGTPNLSAARSFEHYKKRKPFILQMHPHRPTRERVAVGSSFWWKGEQLTCTSFADDGGSIIACSYKEPETEYARAKVKARVRITHAMIQAYHEELRKGKTA